MATLTRKNYRGLESIPSRFTLEMDVTKDQLSKLWPKMPAYITGGKGSHWSFSYVRESSTVHVGITPKGETWVIFSMSMVFWARHAFLAPKSVGKRLKKLHAFMEEL